MVKLLPMVCSHQSEIQRVKAITLKQVLDGLDHVDLIDLDVQGAELVVLRSAIGELDKKVKRVHIGTHGHDIEHGLRELFRQHGWYKANDYCSAVEKLLRGVKLSLEVP